MSLPSHRPHLLQAAILLLLLALAAVSPSTAQQAESIDFVQYDPSPSLPEEQPAGTLLTRFVVFYLNQSGTVRTDGNFSISSTSGDHTYFTISSSGELRSASVFDRDADGAQELFRLDVTYTTPAGTSDSRSIIVLLQDINDNTPAFVQDVFNVSVFEATAGGSVFAAVTATDPDVVARQQLVDYVNEVVIGFRYTVENGRVIYEIVDGNELGHFRLDPDTGNVSVAMRVKLDYDDLRFYNFTIRARDGDNQTDYATLIIHVLDSNDNAPIITGPFGVSVTIPEDIPPGYIIVDHINTTDGDHDANADILFSIIDGDPLNVFSIDPTTGRITTSGALDREFASPITLVAAAIDLGEPPLTGTVEVYVTLLDINDSPPQFEQDNYIASVSEADRVGTSVVLVSASDPDLNENGTVSYFLIGPAQPFSIHPSSGQIVTTATMDRESVDRFVLTVGAVDNSTFEALRMTSFVNVTVTVTDINDNFPYFDRPYFEANLLDSAPVGEEVVQLYAFDDDFGSNAQIRWEVLIGDTATFRFDLSSGRVTVAADLRFETEYQFNYSLIAWDMGAIPNSNTTRLFITVHNENENPPVFEQPAYNVTLNESVAVNSIVLNVSAQDEDPSFIGEVRYRVLTEFDAAGSFGVDPVTGDVFIATKLDYDFRSNIEFQIEAYDGGFPEPFTDVANISVELLDVNDNPPSFSFDPRTFTFDIFENRPAGEFIANIMDFIVDPDTGLGGVYNFTISQGGFEELPPEQMNEDDPLIFLEVEFNETLCNLIIFNSSAMLNGSFNETLFNETFCNLTSQNATKEEVGPSYLVHFELDETTGVLRSGRSFDRETEPFIALQIMMWDFGSPPLTSYTNVTIRVLDENDNNPYFVSNFSGSIIEYNEIGEQFLTVIAFDDDIDDNARLTYSIYSGNELQRFAIHPDNGSIYATARLNKTEINRYVLGIMAVDNGDPKRYTRQIAYAEIAVLDFNDNPPVFPNEFIHTSVPENSNFSTPFYQVQASDEDIGSNSVLTYYLLDSEDSDRFALDPVSGLLATNDTFDAENETEIFLTVVAMDMGRIPLTATAVIVVAIVDLNDKEPFFLDESYNTTVVENSPLGTYVITVEASDDDRDANNSAIRFSISGNRSEAFTIGENTGDITVDGEVDWEAGSVFDIIITASDTGTPSLSATAILTVTVVDVNDNPPVFEPSSLSLGVVEDLPAGAVVGQLVTTDADSEGNNTAVTFTITMDFALGRFELDPNTGIVTTTTTLNREARDEYDIFVRAVDHGDPPLSTEANVTITVLDANDHSPQFVQEHYEGSIPENSPLGTPVLTVEATDRDTGVNGDIRYSLSSDAVSFFAINATSGVLFTNSSAFDFEGSVTSYTFTVLAEDQGVPMRNATATVLVTVTDTNDHPPEFSRNVYYGKVPENYAIGTIILQVNATDIDTGFGGVVRFGLGVGNGSEYFGIDEETGVLHTVLHVDHEITPNVTLIVMATNPLAPSNQVSNATIELTVLDMNDNHPTFSQSAYDILLPEDTNPGNPFTTVTAIDGDLGENGTITYSIISGNDDDLFQIDAASGELSLTRRIDFEVLPNMYTLGLMATDGSVDSLSNYTTLYIHVQDINDNPPLFASDSSTVTISFGTTAGGEVVVLEARDADSLSTNHLTYSIVRGNDTQLFNVSDPNVGRIEAIQALTSYAGDSVRLVVMVSDGTREDFHQLMIEIVQTSPTLPVFSPPNPTGSVSEDASMGHSILDVTAFRAVDYMIVSGNDDNIFEINTVGTLSLAQSGLLDFENKSVYQLTVAGINGNDVAYTVVTILVTDVNEFPPMFPHSSYFVAVSESVDRGSPILQLSSMDSDGSTLNTQTVYSITMTTALANTFRIDSSSGELRLNGRLDYELGDRNFTVVVEAANQIDPTNFKDSTTVHILVLEDNDNSPTFDAPSYVFNLVEGSMVGMVIIDLNASDIDTGSNSQISFGLTGNHHYTDFVIDPHSGVVTIGAELDREREANYILEVHGTDMGSSPREGIIGVTISILDLNDNTPIWESEQYARTIVENITLNSVLLTVTATDADQIDLSNGTEIVYHVTNGLVSYSITGGDPLNQFSIHNATGVVTVTKPLDRETIPSYNITLTATDGGGRYSNAYLSVVLLDVNDSPPDFTMETYVTSVSEHAPLGEELLTVSAIDPDKMGLNSNFTYALQSGNEEGKFILNDTTGILSTVGFLDRESTPMYNLTVIAVDFGSPQRTGTAIVLVHVRDENDHTPLFGAPSYFALVPENTTVGNVILTVTARDSDTGSNGAILYRLFAIAMVAIDNNASNESSTELTELIPSTIFEITNSSIGAISLRSEVDYETQTEYDVILVAYDSATASVRRSSSAELKVMIEDVNDNSPVFALPSYTATVKENSPLGTFVLSVNATDNDVFDVITFSIESTVPVSNPFLMIGNGTIITSGQLDRELYDQYTLQVRAIDTSSPPHDAFVTVTITVTDRNEHAPQFSQPAYLTAVFENQPPNELLTSVLATDADLGLNADISYQLVETVTNYAECLTSCNNVSLCGRVFTSLSPSHNDSSNKTLSLFAVNQYNGDIRSVSSYDREASDWYVVVATATDQGTPPDDPPLSSSVCVAVEIVDLNDNPPLFVMDVFEVNVEENHFPANSLLLLAVTDEDIGTNTDTEFSILQYTAGGGAFRLLPQGDLQLMEMLDREATPVINLTVMAANIEAPRHSSTAFVVVTVDDVNDNPPVFEADSYQAPISENLPSGSYAITVTARDEDVGVNALVVYSISSVSPGSENLFAIDSNSGNISTLSMLDREAIARHTLVITATDSGTLPLSSNVTVVIDVTDTNDHPPVFSQLQYTAVVPENEPTFPVATILATDGDIGLNAVVYFFITSVSPYTEAFSIDNSSGVVVLIQPLDAEEYSEYELTITANNGPVTPYVDNNVTLTVTVEDRNDNSPLFDFDIYQTAISERAAIGSELLTVTAEDIDILPQNSQVVYFIDESGFLGNKSGGVPFYIHTDNGTIMLTEQLDFENITRYDFDVVAMDTGIAPQSSSTRVVIFVQNSNDNFPIFSQPSYQFFVVENNSPGFFIGSVSASDVDMGQLMFIVEYGDDSSSFQIDSQSGEIFANGTFDREMQSEYAFNVTVVDYGPDDIVKSATVEVFVGILDQNDNPPVFEAKMYGQSVPENISLESEVLYVTAFDPDFGPNGTITYRLVDSADASHFQINSTSGEIRTGALFDRETQSEFSLFVEAADGGDPTLAVTAGVLIVVTDINDNHPVFTQSIYSMIIDENIPITTPVIYLGATDADIDENSELRFAIDGDHFDRFSVHPQTGVISTSAAIDYEVQPFYNFTAIVTDLGTPPLSSSVVVTVEIVDLNDNSPVFDRLLYNVTIAENNILDSPVFHIPATDEDSTSNGELRYTITRGNTGAHFALDEITGDITTATYLDREQVSFYEMGLQVVDQGSPQFTAAATLQVRVLDENDNRPQFERRIYEFRLSELLPGDSGTVSSVSASDADSGVNGELRYSIVDGSSDGRFSINETSGVITAVGPLSFTQTKSVTLSIEARDGGSPSLYDTAIVNIQVDDVNAFSPVTSVTSYEVDITDNAVPGTAVIYLRATDDDRNSAADVTYSLTSGDTNLFAVDTLTGAVTVAGSLAARTGTHSVTVTLSDGTLTRDVVVQIEVNPISTSKPIFDPFALEVEVPEPAASSGEISLTQLSTSGSGVTIRLPSSQSTSTIYSDSSNAAGLAELSSAFRVDPGGSLILTDPSYLDRERRDAVIVPVEAINSGTGDTAYGTVTIRIVDANDSPPIFDSSVYHLGVTEATNADIMLVLLRVHAYDLDQAGENSAISYSITNGNDRGHFEIDGDSGDVMLVLPLDREDSPSHYITVRATNHQSSLQLSSEAYISVTVFDDNDNTPSFAQPNYHVELLDTTVIGTEIFHSEVFDPDEGLNSELVFSFTYESHPGVFELNASSGVISTAQRVTPQPTTPGYEVTLDVADRGFPVPHHRSVCVFIDVFPVNTLPPVFSQDVYLVSIPETLSPGSDVTTVTAVDGDTNTSQGVSLTFLSGNEEGDFFIASDTGEITTTMELDFLQQNFYSLVVMATDNGRPVTMATTATVNVTVIDINNHVPQFDQLSYSTVVKENVTVGTVILRVQAADVDADSIIYIISRNAMDLDTGAILFAINSSTGEISIAAPLNYEQFSDHQLTVSAVDTGYPAQRSNNVPVTIAITDLNDMAPEFSTGQYPDVVVYRLQQVGMFVTMVTATDSDSVGEPVMYSIQSGDSDNLFRIDATTGDITVSREIPEVTSSAEYVLVVGASDGSLSSTATVRVLVQATGTYCEANFCTEIVDRHRERCPDGLSPSPDPSPSFTVGGELCIRYYCTSGNTYPCLTTRTCVANGYSCAGACPSGESVCPTTDLCHSVTLATTCDGSNATCLEGQILVQTEDGSRVCAQPQSLPPTASSCTQPNTVYCTLLDQCSSLTASHLCQHCPPHLFYCPTTDSCLPSEQQCCDVVEYYCDVLAMCLPNGGRCELPNVAPHLEQGLFLAEVVMSFDQDAIYSINGYVIGLLLGSANQTATDNQGEELGVAITEVQEVPLTFGEWQFATCRDSLGDTFGSCSYLTSPWQPLPSGIGQSNAFLLPPDSRLRFVRKTLELEGSVWLRVKLWDGNEDGYLSPAQNLTRSQNPHFETTLPYTSNGAFSEHTTLIAALLYPESTLPEFRDVGVSVRLSAIREEEIPIYNQGSVLQDVVGDVHLTYLPVLDDAIIGGFPSVPPRLNISQYQALLPTNVVNGYLDAVSKANPSRRARAYARGVGQDPGVAVSFDPPFDSTHGRWQVSGSGSAFDWTYLDDLIDGNSVVLVNTSALIRFIPAEDFHGNVSILFQPWDGYWNDAIATVTPNDYIVTSSLSNQTLSLNSAVTAELEVLSVEEDPSVFKQSFELDPIPYSILYTYERLFTLEIEQSVDTLRQDQSTIAQLLQVALGHAVQIQRFLPSSDSSSLMSFSVIDHALTFDEVVAKVTSNAATLNKLIGRVLGVGRDAFYSPGASCYGNSLAAQPLHGTQVQQVMTSVAMDDDSNVLGMAVIGSSNGPSEADGVWQYYRANYSDPSIVLQNGVTSYHPESFPWVNFPSSLSETEALLLRPQDRVRFVPKPNYFWNNSSKPHIEVKAWDLSLWQSQLENGRLFEQHFHSIDTDPFTTSVRSLVSPVGRFSTTTVIVSVGRIGCDDIIGSGLVHNPCCVCGENGNANASSCESRCGSQGAGSPAQSYDSCDVCGGDDDSCLGCDFVPFSEAAPQGCAVCLGEVSIPTSSLGEVQYWNMSHLIDCAGSCFGTAITDQCSVCSGGSSGHDYNSDMDCSGVCFGSAVIDNCGYCTGGTTGLQFDQHLDCSGTCNGPFVADCGVCYNPASPIGPATYRDCTGECNGRAQIDVCGVCFGGSSLVQTANSTQDRCGVCDGDNSSCTGCDGLTSSGRVVDACGQCSGNNCGCLRLTSASPLVGPNSGGTMLLIMGAGFFINDSSLFNSSLPNCGTPTRLPDGSLIPVDCSFRSVESQQQFQGAAYIVNQSTIICSSPDTTSISGAVHEFEIVVRVNRGAVLSASPPILFQASDYSGVNVFSMSPVDAPIRTSPTVIFAGDNFINSSHIGCRVNFGSCSPPATDTIVVVGTFLSSTEISCQLPPSNSQCTVTVQLSLNGQAVGIVPQNPSPANVFDFIYGDPPPNVLSVHFSSNLQLLLVTFDTPVELVSGSQLSCSAVFTPQTLVALGNVGAQCSWNSIKQREIAITLPSVATVTDGTEITFLDDVIVAQVPEEVPIDARRNYRRIPIRNLSVPVNGSVNRVIPIAVIEGQPNIPSCPTTIRFHGGNSLHPGYREFVYTWSVLVHDTSIQGYPELVNLLSNLPPDTRSVSFSSDLLQPGVEYYLQLVVQNSQGHYSEPDWLLLTQSSQWDTVIDVQIQGLSNRTVTTTDNIFLVSQVSISDCFEFGNGYMYRWRVYRITDAVRGTLSEATLVGVALSMPTIFVPSAYLVPLEAYIFVLQVNVTGTDMTGSDNVTVTVEPRGPVARIFGGDHRNVFRNGTIVLDATPSLIHPALGSPTFVWTCQEEVTQQPCYNKSGGVIRINSNTSTITFPAETLNASFYRFSVVITQGVRQSSAETVIQVEGVAPGNQLHVGISPIDVVTATGTVILEGRVYTNTLNVIAEWRSLQEPGYGVIDDTSPSKLKTLGPFSVEPFYVNRVDLVIAPETLLPGVRYLFELTAISGGAREVARIEVEVDAPPLVQEVRVDPPTGEPLNTLFTISTAGQNVESKNLPLMYRYGIQNGSSIFWLSGVIPSPSLETILPSLSVSQSSSLQVVVQVRDSVRNVPNLSTVVELAPPSINAEAVDQIRMRYAQNGNWIEALASLGSYLYSHSAMGISLDNDTVGVVTDLLFNISAVSLVDTPTHHQLVAQYLSVITLSTDSLSEPMAEDIARLISQTLMEHTFETIAAPTPVDLGLAVDVLNFGTLSGAQESSPSTDEISQNLVAIEQLIKMFPSSIYLRELYPQLLDTVSSGACSLLSIGEEDSFLSTPNTQLSVRKISPSHLGGGTFKPCRSDEACSSVGVGQSFSSSLREQICNSTVGRTLQLCEEVCLQGNQQMTDSEDNFELAEASKMRILANISRSVPDSVRPVSDIFSFSVPILSANGNGYAMLPNLDTPINVSFPLMGTFPSNDSELLCLYRQRGGGGSYANEKWLLDTTVSPNVEEIDGVTRALCQYNHLTEFVCGVVLISPIPSSSPVIMSSTPLPSTSMATTSPTPSVVAPPPGGAVVNPAAYGVPIVLVLIAAAVVVVICVVIFFVWRNKKRRAKVGISDEAGPSGEVAEEDGIKTEDHRVSMGVIALLEEGQRDLLGNVLVLPNARLKAVREAVTGTFEERLQRKPFYMVTTDFSDIEPAVEPHKYLNIVYTDTVFIRLVYKKTETTLRHFCHCGKVSAFECSQCVSRGYCGTDCQLEDWEREHGRECKRLAEKRRRAEVLGRRATVPTVGSPTTEQPADLASPTSSMGKSLTGGSARDWKAFLMSQRQANLSTLRTRGALTPIEEDPRPAKPLPSEGVDTDTHATTQTSIDRETLTMKPPPKMADPFTIAGKPPSAPSSARKLPPISRPSHIAMSPPSTAPTTLDQPMKPHDSQSYYWNRFKATTRKDVAQAAPFQQPPRVFVPPQLPKVFIPPQPLEASPAGFTPVSPGPATTGISPRSVGLPPHAPSQQTPAFTRPPMFFKRAPPSRGQPSIHSVTSEDLDLSLNASQLGKSLREQVVLEEDQSTSDSDSSTESTASEESAEEAEGQEDN